MWSMVLLSCLIAIPVIAFRVARRNWRNHAFCIAGIAFGAIVAPWAFGLYSWFVFSPFGVVPGAIGLALVAIHEPPGFMLATHLSLIPRGEVLSGLGDRLTVEFLNGIIWAAVYGVLGGGIDFLRTRRKSVDG